MEQLAEGPWQADWLWSLLLIMFTVVIHVVGLGLINENIDRVLGAVSGRRRVGIKFVLVMGSVAWAVTFLHGIEATAWALAYRWLGAVEGDGSAMLYSLSALTSYGHASVFLKPRWQLMGALEALNGIMLFGLTTAFMFAMIQKVWPAVSSR